MSRTLERYLKTVRGPSPDADALATMEAALLEARDLESLATALKTRLQVLEEKDGPQPMSLSLRKRLAETLMEVARTVADDDRASASAAEAMEIFAHALNDAEGLKTAALLLVARGAADANARRSAAEKVGGVDYLLKQIKKALKEESDLARKAGMAFATAAMKEEAGDKAGAFTDYIRAARWMPSKRLHVDELLRASMELDRHTEAEAVLQELAEAPASMGDDARAYLLSKVGTLRNHLGNEQGAFAAFARSLELEPNQKAAAKQARRLADKLGISWTAPAAREPASTPPQPAAAPTPEPTPAPAPLPEPPPAQAFLYERTGPALLSDLPHKVADPFAGMAPAGMLSPPLPRLLAHGFPGAGEFSSDRLAPVPVVPPFRGPNDEISNPRQQPPAEPEPTPVAPEPTPVSTEPTPATPDPTPVSAERTSVTAVEETPPPPEPTPVSAELTPISAELTPVSSELTPVYRRAEEPPLQALPAVVLDMQRADPRVPTQETQPLSDELTAPVQVPREVTMVTAPGPVALEDAPREVPREVTWVASVDPAPPAAPETTEVALLPVEPPSTEDTAPVHEERTMVEAVEDPAVHEEKTMVSSDHEDTPATDEKTTSGVGPEPQPEEPDFVDAELVEPVAPPPPKTAEDFLRLGQPENAVPLLLERLGNNPRVADLLLLAEQYENGLKQHAEALQFFGRAALRLAERGDPKDFMLRRSVDGALRMGPSAVHALARLADQLTGKLTADDELNLQRTTARLMLREHPAEAAARLVKAYDRNTSSANVQAVFEEADRALALAGNRRGQADLRKLARERSDDPRARVLLSRERADLLKFEGAREFAAALADVLEDDPNDGAALEKLLNAWEQARGRGEPVGPQYADALTLAARLQKGEAGLPPLRRLARLRDELGQREEALKVWRDVLARRPGDAEALRMLTEILESFSQDPVRAEELARVLEMRLTIARNTRDAGTEALLLPRLASLEGRLGHEEQRVALLREVLRVDPNNDSALQVVEAHLTEQEAFDELADLFEDLASRRTGQPARTTALLSAAVLFRQRLGKPARARECLQEVLRAEPDNPTALLQLAELALELNNAAEAVEHLTKAASLLKGSARAVTMTRLGAVREEQMMELEAAAHCYREALLADPGYRAAMEALLSVAQRTGKSAEARTVAADLAAMEPDPARRAEAFLQLARKARESGENDQAVRLYDTALAADPTQLDAVEELCWILVQRGDGRRARPLLERLVTARGADNIPPPLLVSLAKTLWAGGETAPAKERLRAALRKDPSMLEALRALGDLLLAGKDEDPQEVLSILETRVLYHGEKLEKEELAFIHAQAGRLRMLQGDSNGALRSLKRALSLMPQERPDPEALLALAKLTEDAGRPDEAQELYARLARRVGGVAAASHWVKVGALARARGDQQAAATALQEARKLDPNRKDVARALMEVEMARGNSGAAVTALMELLSKEDDPLKQAAMHVSLAKLQRDGMAHDDKAALHLRKALELEPANREAMDLAEQIFLDRKDARGLVGVYTSSLRNLPASATDDRLVLWEKVALLRRYELKDLPGAVTALEEILKIDDNNAKAREDLARLYVELGNADAALNCWRLLLTRDPLSVDAYRGMLAIFRRQLAFDAAFCVCATLVALDEAEEENRTVVRALRPPFPTWPRPTADAEGTVRRLMHPRARGPARDLLQALAPFVLPVFVKPLSHHGLTRKNQVELDEAPPSFSLAAKHASRLLGVPLALFKSDNATGITLLVSEVSGVLLGPDAIKGGMTPERAFSFGRAAAYLRPDNLLVAALNVVELRNLLEAVVVRAQGGAEVEGNRAELDRLGREMERVVPPSEWPRMLLLARDWWRERTSQPLTELVAATAFSADRVGFLFAQDLAAAVAMMRQNTGSMTAAGVRSAIRELVLFSVSPELFALRQELGPAVNSSAAARIFGEA